MPDTTSGRDEIVEASVFAGGIEKAKVIHDAIELSKVLPE
jgi:hypothetical protein